MPKRFVSGVLPAHTLHGHALELRVGRRLVARLRMLVVPRVAEEGALDALVGIWGVFGAKALFAGVVTVALDTVATARAAARAEEPEEPRSPGEEDGEPDEDVHVVADGAVDVVFRQGVVECAHEGGVEDGGCECESHDEGAADGADDGGGQAAEAAEQGEKANYNFNGGGDDGHDVGNVHPFCDGFINLEAVVELLAENLVGLCLIEAPYFDRIEPKLGLPFGAMGHIVTFVSILVVKGLAFFQIALAVVP